MSTPPRTARRRTQIISLGTGAVLIPLADYRFLVIVVAVVVAAAGAAPLRAQPSQAMAQSASLGLQANTEKAGYRALYEAVEGWAVVLTLTGLLPLEVHEDTTEVVAVFLHSVVHRFDVFLVQEPQDVLLQST